MYTIVTKDDCVYCTAAKRLLVMYDQPFREVRQEEEEATKIKEQHGWPTYPVILKDDKLIGGHTELQRALY